MSVPSECRLVWIAMVMLLTAGLAMGGPAPEGGDVLYQVSTINVLLDGGYDGMMTFGRLKKHGDIGIGTFDKLDGESIMLDGVVYQASADGKVQLVPDSMTTPFACVTCFQADETLDLKDIKSLEALKTALDAKITTRTVFYAVRIDGVFADVKYRSVPKQAKPYPKLAEVAKTQPVFERKNIKGTLVGFWCPELAKALNVPGWHLHFLSDDRQSGGHLLDCNMVEGRAQLDLTSEFFVMLPTSGADAAGAAAERAAELKAVEQ